MQIPLPNNPDRRRFLVTSAAFVSVAVAPPAFALTTAEARSLIANMVADINAVINSGRSESQMYGDFERIFIKYGDLSYIAPVTLGPPARSASSAQMQAYTRAFTGYMARKYGKRFREFIGGQIVVQNAGPLKSFYQVKTLATLRGEPPFNLTFHVSDRTGRNLFFDMRIEGISLLKSERTEVGAMLDRRRGNLDKLIADLKRAG